MIAVLCLFIFAVDIPVNTSYQDQSQPSVQCALNQYYVFWYDMRHYSPERAIYCARISEGGAVVDTQGVPLMIDRTMTVNAAFDGENFLAVIQDSC